MGRMKTGGVERGWNEQGVAVSAISARVVREVCQRELGITREGLCIAPFLLQSFFSYFTCAYVLFFFLFLRSVLLA